jgi:hypothetical protein
VALPEMANLFHRTQEEGVISQNSGEIGPRLQPYSNRGTFLDPAAK